MTAASGGGWNATADVMFRIHDPRFWNTYRLDVEATFPADPPKERGETCRAWLRGHCTRGERCVYLHARTDKAVVCKHWLRGLCKKGEQCEFLHEFRTDKMPECFFYSKFGECNNPECLYLHLSNTQRGKECAWYLRGYCKHGPLCRSEHVRRPAPCQYYIAGFCPDGPNCKFGHPKFDVSRDDPHAGAVTPGAQSRSEALPSRSQ